MKSKCLRLGVGGWIIVQGVASGVWGQGLRVNEGFTGSGLAVRLREDPDKEDFHGYLQRALLELL